MKAVIYILLSGVLTWGTSAAAGSLAARWLRLRLDWSLSWILGAAILSTSVFLMGVAGIVYKSAFIALAVLLMGAAAYLQMADRRRRAGWRRAPAGTAPLRNRLVAALSLGYPWWLMAAFWGVYLCFGWLYLSHALSPETSADALAYHVGLPARYADAHRIFSIPTTFLASFPGGVEMLFLFAFPFARDSAGSIVEFLFLALTPFAILIWARDAGHRVAGWFGATLFYVSPIVGRDGTVGYIDVATAAIAFALFHALEEWRKNRDLLMLAVAGIIAGFGAAAKYTLVVGIFYAIAVVAFENSRWRVRLRNICLVSLCAALVVAPWLVRNAITVGNPVSPFLTRVFPDSSVCPSSESDFSRTLRSKSLKLSEYPVDAAVRGASLDGVAGPVFLLAPMALLALRKSAGRRVLFGAVLFLLPAVAAASVRLAIPSLLFTAIAMGMALESYAAVACLVASLHALSCWPSMVNRYANIYAWRIENSNWPVALRWVSEDQYLRSRMPEYDIWNALRTQAPPGSRVLSSFEDRIRQPHELIVTYQSAFGNRIAAAMNQVLYQGMRPTCRIDFTFPTRGARRVRLMLADNGDALWSIAEMRVYLAGIEIPRNHTWRLSARPNGRDVQSAFDNSPFTFWNAREYRPEHAFVQIDFGEFLSLDRLTADLPDDICACKMKIEAQGDGGEWTPLQIHSAKTRAPYPDRSRRAAAEELKANNIRWIVTGPESRLGGDLLQHFYEWGTTATMYANGFRLWRLD